MPMAFPGYTGRIPRSATPLPRVLRDAGYNTLAVGKWHLVPGGERSRRGPVRPLAARLRLRALLRLPPGRHQPLGARTSCATTTTSSRRARRDDGYHLTEDLADAGDPARHRPAAGRARPAVLPLLRARRDARAAPRRARVGRAVPRRVRRRLGAVARRRVRAPASSWASCPRAPTLARAAELGRTSGTSLPRDAAPHAARASRRCSPGSSSHTDAQIGRVLDAARRARRARRHARDADLRQRRQRRGRRARHVQRAPLHRARARRPSRATSRGSTSSAASVPTTTTRGAGRGPATRRCGCGSATRGSAARARRSSCTGRAASPTPGEVRDAVRARDRPHADGARRCGRRRARHRRRRRAAAGRRRVDPRHVHRRRRALAARRAVLRDARLALDRRRRVEGDDRPRVEGRGRRGAPARGQPRLRRRRVGAVPTSPTTSPRPATSPPTIPTCSPTCRRAGRPRPSATRCSRSSTS